MKLLRFNRKATSITARLLMMSMLMIAAMGGGVANAQEAGAGGGVVVGTVNITTPANGIPLPNDPPGSGCVTGSATAYTFQSTQLQGVLGGKGGDVTPAVFAGSLDANANGGAACENSEGTFAPGSTTPGSGTGTVNGTFGSVNDQAETSASGSFTGEFSRIAVHVYVKLTVTITVYTTIVVDGVTITVCIMRTVLIIVLAVFIPNDLVNGNGVTGRVQSATFRGVFAGAG